MVLTIRKSSTDNLEREYVNNSHHSSFYQQNTHTHTHTHTEGHTTLGIGILILGVM